MTCESGCREVKLLQVELAEVWKELEHTKADLSSLQTDHARSEERQVALEKTLSALRATIDKMSDRIDSKLDSIVTDISKISGEVKAQKARAEFTITWKEITAAGIAIIALANAIRPLIGG